MLAELRAMRSRSPGHLFHRTLSPEERGVLARMGRRYGWAAQGLGPTAAILGVVGILFAPLSFLSLIALLFGVYAMGFGVWSGVEKRQSARAIQENDVVDVTGPFSRGGFYISEIQVGPVRFKVPAKHLRKLRIATPQGAPCTMGIAQGRLPRVLGGAPCGWVVSLESRPVERPVRVVRLSVGSAS